MPALPTDSPPAAGAPCLAHAWRLHAGELRGFLRHRLPAPAEADDLLQDVFVKAVRQGTAFCAVEAPRAWLFQVARNALVDHLRRRPPDEALSDALLASLADDREPEAPVDALAGCLEHVLHELPAADAQVLRACDLQGQGQREFAQAQGLSLAAAKARLLRARRRLRERMTAACQVRFDDTGAVEGHAPRAGTAPR